MTRGGSPASRSRGVSRGHDRRGFLRLAARAGAGAVGVGLLGGLAGCSPGAAKARVVVLGGGFGGATAARYLRRWDPGIEVVLVERNERFTSCPMSNLVIGGHRRLDQLQYGYGGLSALGVDVRHDEATAVYPHQHLVRLASGGSLSYDRLVVSPGVDFVVDDVPGCEAGLEVGRILHAWKAGPQTTALRERLEAMPDGGVFVLSIPPAPYRCPPGPYERVCQVADYFRRAKPDSRIVVVDANPEIVSKGALFQGAWETLYPGMIDYRPGQPVTRIDGDAMLLEAGGEIVRGDVINVIPPQRAGEIARRAGLTSSADGRWCGVEWRTLESLAVPDVHVLGDATESAVGMPKSGHMANAQAKVCAAAIIAAVNGHPPDPDPVMTNTCFSFVSAEEVIHVSSVHRWDASSFEFAPVTGAGGLSPERYPAGAEHAWSWARNIWADMLG